MDAFARDKLAKLSHDLEALVAIEIVEEGLSRVGTERPAAQRDGVSVAEHLVLPDVFQGRALVAETDDVL